MRCLFATGRCLVILGHAFRFSLVMPCSHRSPFDFAGECAFPLIGEKVCRIAYHIHHWTQRSLIRIQVHKQSQGLNLNCDFRRRSPRMPFLPGISPAYRSPWCAHIVTALRRKAYPIRTVMQFSRFSGSCQVHCSEKMRPFPYIQEDGKGRQIGVISTLMDGGQRWKRN